MSDQFATESESTRRFSTWRSAALFALAALVVLGFVQCVGRSGEPTNVPEIFDLSITLEEAIDASKQDGRPVMAFITAEWCGPCQVFKKGALSEPGVQAWVRENLHTVYIDIDHRHADARRLGVSVLPTTVILSGENAVAHTTGVMPPERFLAWLEANSPAAETD